MKFIGLDGQEYNVVLKEMVVDDEHRSGLHLQARNIIKTVFPFERILEEVPLPGTNLIADFFIPNLRLIIEVDGAQHQKLSLHYHKDIKGFYKAQLRDKNKERFCEINNIRLIRLPYNKVEQWEPIILGVAS